MLQGTPWRIALLVFILWLHHGHGSLWGAEPVAPLPPQWLRADETFFAEKARLEKEAADQQAEFERRKNDLERQSADLGAQIGHMQRELLDLTTRNMWLAGIHAGLKMVGLNTLWVHIFFPITVLNLLLYLHRTQRPPLYPVQVFTVVAVILLLLFVLPVFAEEAKRETASRTVGQQLDTVNTLLRSSDVERAIFLLEKAKGTVTIPPLSTSNPLLSPWREVTYDTAAYYYTLGSLYWEANRKSDALSALRQVVPRLRQPYRMTVQEQEMLSRLGRFFLAENRSDDALAVVERALSSLREQSALLELLVALREKELHAAADRVVSWAREAADSHEEALAGARFLKARGDQSDAERMAAEAVARSPNVRALLAVGGFILDSRFEALVAPLRERTVRVARDADDLISAGDFFFGRGYGAEAEGVLRDAVASTTRARTLVPIAQYCVGKERLSLAVTAIERAIAENPQQAVDITIDDPQLLYPSSALPAVQPLSLRVYLGVLRQKLGMVDEARAAFEQAAQHEFDRVIRGAAFTIPVRLNTLFYLREL